MTERKPREVTFESWVDRQIRTAQEAGEFDDLPGYGRPIPDHGDDPNWWLRAYLDREGLSAEALLPESLQLRKELERLPARVDAAADEAEVRHMVSELNRRIVDWVRRPSGPDVPLRAASTEEMLARFRSRGDRCRG